MILESENITPVDIECRREKPVSLIFKWFSGSINVGIFPIIFLLSRKYHADTLISICFFSSFFFVVVAINSIPGYRLGLPTMAYTKKIFTTKIARLISLFFLFINIGWQVVGLTTLFYLLLSAIAKFENYSHFISVLLSIGLGSILAYLVPLVGRNTLVIAQKLSSIGIIVISFFIFLHWHHDPSELLSSTQHVSNNNVFFILAGLSLLLMAGSLSWVPSASDYTRFINQKYSAKSVFLSTFTGGFLGNAFLLFIGYLFYLNGGVTITQNGIKANGFDHNIFLYLCVLVLFIVSLISNNFLASYSTTFQASVAIGIDVKKFILLFIDAIISVVLASLILFQGGIYISSVVNFLTIGEILVAPWAGIATVNSIFFMLEYNVTFATALEFVSATSKRNLNSVIFVFDVILTSCFAKNILWHGFFLPFTDNYNIAPVLGFILPIVVIPLILLFFYIAPRHIEWLKRSMLRSRY